MGGIRTPIGAASCPAIEIRGEGVFLFIGQIKAQVSSYREVWRRLPIGPLITLGLILFPESSKTNRRQIMSNYKTWQPPQNTSDAIDTMDKLSALIQFVADLTSQPSPPINEYSFSEDGYSGLYYFLVFVQETIADCQDAIHKNS